MIEKYFEQFYFARKKFMINFLTRNEGKRWHGRFKTLYKKNKIQGVLNVLGRKRHQRKSQLEKGEFGCCRRIG